MIDYSASLSHNSSITDSKIRRYDITPSQPKVLLLGSAPYWTNVAANLLRRAHINHNICKNNNLKALITAGCSRKFRPCDILYHIGGVCDKPLDLLLPLTKKPLIWHWIGTDFVTWTKGKASRGLRRRLNQFVINQRVTVHLSDSPELARELSEIDIDAKVVRLLPERIAASVSPLPDTPAVMSYWPDERKDFYGGDLILPLAREFPEVPFLITLARPGRTPAPDNVKFLGPVDNIEEIYEQSTVFIRIPQHDSLSAMVLEMLARGRYVIYNKEFPHCAFAQNYEQVRECLRKILAQTTPNEAGAQYVRQNFSLSEQAQTLSEICHQLLK